jgi:hypothetical protein
MLPLRNDCTKYPCPGGALQPGDRTYTDPIWIAKVITYKNDGKRDLLKINSFRTCHIAHKIAQVPTLRFIFSDLDTPLCQLPKRLLIFRGDVKLKAKRIIDQTMFAKGHSIKRC